MLGDGMLGDGMLGDGIFGDGIMGDGIIGDGRFGDGLGISLGRRGIGRAGGIGGILRRFSNLTRPL
ncbi:hypothetical protein KDJ56_13750 [Brevibacillus composti]|uniref:Uncharacterized protein n=2 Tax=Brevibacillus composti TaxID=2796470 RepID=A0A7T5EQ14_9BACL|nr:hypothetical protein JD108_13805 [Brevibacillus composti]QUO43703.1 hypothetical protein KDJ56_13750 [Brevibacillus composti]